MIKEANGIDFLKEMKQQLQTVAGADPDVVEEIDKQIVEIEELAKKDISEIVNQQ